MKILIAEDDTTSRLLLEYILENWKYDVVATNDGKEAWGVLQNSPEIRIAILDWEMPELDGVEICRRRKERKKNQPM